MSETAKQAIASLFSPEQAKKVVEALEPKKRPQSWGRRSRATYYGEEFALQVKKVIDDMLVDKKDRIFFYSSYPQFTPNTVYLRINQSLRFLLEEMDVEGTYRKAMSTIDVHRDRIAKGIRFSVRQEFRDSGDSNFVPAEIIPTVEMPKWKQKIEDWLETSEPGSKPFILDRLALTPEEVKELKLQFMGLTNIVAVINAKEIKLVKLRV